MLTALQQLPRDTEVLAFEAGCEEYCECEVDDYLPSSRGLRDVDHELRRRLRAGGGSGYLPSSTTEEPEAACV
jgi:hypothetical protein